MSGMPSHASEARNAAALALLATAGHAHLLHHLLHVAELLDEPADLARLAARALGDAGPAAAVDDLRVGALLGCHRMDHRLDRLEHVVVDLGVLELLRHAGHHPEDPRERAHLLDRLHLLEEVVEGELTLHQAGRGLLGLVGLERLLGLLDEGHHVAHAQDAAKPCGRGGTARTRRASRPSRRTRSDDRSLP